MKRVRVFFIILVAFLVMVEVLILRPSRLEVNESNSQKGMFKDLTAKVRAEKHNDEVRYTMQKFHYTAVEGEQKQWEMNADTAILYEGSQLVVANTARIKMFDAEGKITLIVGDEAHYSMGAKNFDLFRNVKVTFPDGFWIKTEKAHYQAKSGLISTDQPFYGESQSEDKSADLIKVWGTGFQASRLGPDIHVLADSRVKVLRRSNNEESDVKSDKSRIDRLERHAYFFMNDPKSFVESDLGTLHVKSRRQDTQFGSASEKTGQSVAGGLKYMTALEDVLITETDAVKSKQGLKYATCQRADFMSKENKIIMTGFPQVYQENDTVTGELITIHRNENLVEVMQANGYHDGRNLSASEKTRSKESR